MASRSRLVSYEGSRRTTKAWSDAESTTWEASARHVAKSEHEAQFGELADGFTAHTTVGELSAWWLEHVARHRVRPTSLATYRKHASVIDDKLGSAPVCDPRAEQVTTFVSDLLDEGSASRAKNVRTLLVQILEQGVEFGLTTQNVARKVKAPKAAPKQRRTITPAQTQHLIAECDPRFAAPAGLCFVQGWRISKALGLAWQDIDLDEGSVLVRRGSTYADRVGMVIGPTKTRGATGVQMLGRTVVSLLRARRDLHEVDRAAHPGPWPTVEYDGEQLDLVFTTADGTPNLRNKPDGDRAARTPGAPTNHRPCRIGVARPQAFRGVLIALGVHDPAPGPKRCRGGQGSAHSYLSHSLTSLRSKWERQEYPACPYAPIIVSDRRPTHRSRPPQRSRYGISALGRLLGYVRLVLARPVP